MKKTFIGIVCVSSLILACAPREDGSCDIVWTLALLAVGAVCGLIYDRLDKIEKRTIFNIPYENYDTLNAQIEDYAYSMEEGYDELTIESRNVSIKVGFNCKCSSGKFTDEAWGARQTFTEYTRNCDIEIKEVKVYDNFGDRVEVHDFDEEMLQREYERSWWE